MGKEDKINYMRIAAGIVGYGFNYEQLDLLTSLYSLIEARQGECTIEEILCIKKEVKNRANAKMRSEMLDKVSEKVV